MDYQDSKYITTGNIIRKERYITGKAIQDLRNEHQAILHVLIILDNMLSTVTKEDIEIFKFGDELIYFLKTFADKCHHGKEEDYLFKELVAKGIQVAMV
jgi:hemerythrin-like domain-containing protein